MISKIHVDGRDVEVGNIRAQVSDYTIYDGKIWRITSYNGPAVGNNKGLDRELHREHITLDNSVKLYKVLYPTGYIAI